MAEPPLKYVLRREPAPSPRRFAIDYEAELNPAQCRAVVTTEGPVLVVAGAGTGKTRTLVYRVARLIELGVDPGRVLLLTFTRKAAAEMLRRAGTLLDGRCDRIAGGTFHSFAHLVLRRFGANVGLGASFTILDRSDAEDVINLLRAECGFDKRERRFPRKQGIAELFSMSVNRNLGLDALLDSDYAHLAEHYDDLETLARRYAAYKTERQLVDYDDLLVKLRDLLRDDAAVRRNLAERYRYVMVDEYQDTNALQAEIVRGLADGHDNVMAVGDDAQSIYSFRGADFRNIMEFPKLFPGTRIIAIEENYRSTQPILALGNAIMERARERHAKTLFTHKAGGSTPLLVLGEDEHYQSRFVCQRILELREEGIPLSEIAVLLRAGYHSFGLELELARCDIPFVKRGGIKFIETAHVKDVIAYLRVHLNPRDSVAWYRILLLLDGVGPRVGSEIVAALLAAESPLAVLESYQRAAVATELRALAGLLRQLAHPQAKPVDLIDTVLRYYEPILGEHYPEDHPKRRRDLEQFAVIAERYSDVASFLADLALEPPTDSVDEALALDPDRERVTLSTIHSAKGLEWHTVFVLWVAEGRIPSLYQLSEDGIEEERRLLYVAVTRAKEQLYLTYPATIFERNSGPILGKPSRFVADLPPAILQPVALVDDPVDDDVPF